MPFSPVEEVIEDIKAGKMVIVCDDEDRENEGDLTMAAEFVTADDINFMATYGKGLICLPLHEEIVERLEIPQMIQRNSAQNETAFTVSIEAREGGDDGYIRRGPGLHQPPGGGRFHRPRRPRHARACLPAQGEARRRTATGRPNGGRRRPVGYGGAQAGGCYLRGHEGRRDYGPRAGLRGVLRRARHQNGHRCPAYRIPPHPREDSVFRGRVQPAHQVRRVPR